MKFKGMMIMGATIKQLMAEFGLSRAGVTKIQRKLRDSNESSACERAPGQGRKRKTSVRVDRAIVKYARSDAAPSLAVIVSECKELAGVSKSTVRRRLHEAGNHRCVCTRKPWISELNRKRRLTFAKNHRDWTREDWHRVLWSDESKFVFRYTGQRFVWRRVDERHEPRCLAGTVKGAQRNVMVWSCFNAGATGKLRRINGRINAVGYIEILNEAMLPSAGDICDDAYVYMHDNASIHTARDVRRFLSDKGVAVMEWPAQSPDLNPIENLWFILEHALRSRNPANEEHLFEMLDEAWGDIAVATLAKLVDSMPARMQAVIAANGYPIGY